MKIWLINKSVSKSHGNLPCSGFDGPEKIPESIPWFLPTNGINRLVRTRNGISSAKTNGDWIHVVSSSVLWHIPTDSGLV